MKIVGIHVYVRKTIFKDLFISVPLHRSKIKAEKKSSLQIVGYLSSGYWSDMSQRSLQII